jgi:hypothetical protein
MARCRASSLEKREMKGAKSLFLRWRDDGNVVMMMGFNEARNSLLRLKNVQHPWLRPPRPPYRLA